MHIGKKPKHYRKKKKAPSLFPFFRAREGAGGTRKSGV
jgi:hypothetical protein